MRAVPLALLVAALGVSSCARCNGSSTSAPPAPAASAENANDASGAGLCALLGAPSIVGALAGEDAAGAEGPSAYGAELGGAGADARGFFFGLRAAGLGGASLVVTISPNGGPPKYVASTTGVLGGARAPLAAVSSDGVRLVGALSIEEDARTFRVFRLDDDALTPVGKLRQQKDESEATALGGASAHPLVAWDDVDDALRIGRVRATLLSKTAPADAAPAPDDAVSTPASDASWPTLAPSPDGKRAVLVWSSERPESETTDGGEGEPSQAAAFRWLEAVVVDLESGARLGAPRALTSRDGHVQTFAASWSDAGLMLAVRDDARPTDGDGGALFAARAPIDAEGNVGDATRLPIAEKDVAPGVAALLPRPGGARVVWLAQDGSAHLFPAFVQGASTIEPALRDRRIVATRGDRSLATRLVGSGLEVVVVRCAP